MGTAHSLCGTSTEVRRYCETFSSAFVDPFVKGTIARIIQEPPSEDEGTCCLNDSESTDQVGADLVDVPVANRQPTTTCSSLFVSEEVLAVDSHHCVTHSLADYESVADV